MPGGRRLSLLLLLLLLLYSVFVSQNLRIQPNKTRNKNYRNSLRDQIIQRGTCLVDSLLTSRNAVEENRRHNSQRAWLPRKEEGMRDTAQGNYCVAFSSPTLCAIFLPCVLPRISLHTNWTLLSGCFSSKSPTHKPTEPISLPPRRPPPNTQILHLLGRYQSKCHHQRRAVIIKKIDENWP